jgi:hypothetical protein
MSQVETIEISLFDPPLHPVRDSGRGPNANRTEAAD